MIEPQELPSPTGPGAVLELIRSGRAVTRASLMEVTGLSRSTVAQRLELLFEAGYLCHAGAETSTGGRPAGALAINPRHGRLLLAAAGASGFRAGIADFRGQLLATRSLPLDIARGPTRVLGRMLEVFGELIEQTGAASEPVRGIGIGLPGPVAFAEGRIVRPPIMTGWDDYRVADFFAPHFQAPVRVDNDVNLMALGERQCSFPEVDELLYLKVGTGIGSGLIMSGQLQRGAQGAAGDIGHWFLADGARSGKASRLCRCGNQDCLEAHASGWALCREFDAPHVRALIARLEQGEEAIVQRLRLAGQHIGEALALAVNLVNPALVVVGGELAQDHLLASLREAVYRRSAPLATRRLQILAGPLGGDAGLYGAAHLVTESLLDPRVVERRIAGRAGNWVHE